MFTAAARTPRCSNVCAFVFRFFPLCYLLAQNLFTVREMLMIMLSVWCVHGEKKENTIDKKHIKTVKCLQVFCVGGAGFTLDRETSVQRCLSWQTSSRLCIDVY